MVKTRTLAAREVYPIGFGAMNISYCYQPPLPDDEGAKILQGALDLGYNYIDTAAVYANGKNEQLIAEAIGHRRDEYMLASKFGIIKDPDTGKRGINNRPDLIRVSCEQSLRDLKTDRLDLFYLHRWDLVTPIEDVMGAMSELVAEGKVLHVGLSEVSAATMRKAHAVHPIAAMQSEYSLWTRNPEIAVLDACREIGAAFVAFSPLARQFLTGKLRDISMITEGDIRLTMPRFEPETYARNLKLLDGYAALAEEAGCTMTQLCLAWLLTRGDHVIPIPGTQRAAHMEENFRSAEVSLSNDIVAKLDALINQNTVAGARYNPAIQKQIDTEEFA